MTKDCIETKANFNRSGKNPPDTDSGKQKFDSETW